MRSGVSGGRALRFLASTSVPAALIVASSVLALLCGEVLSRFVVNPGDFLLATPVADPVLGHRIEPYSNGHDALGFRNADVPERVGIVAIGDSMTYGFGVTQEDSWPQQLGVLLHERVYNMSLGGYGPLHYLHLATRQAANLRPRLLLVGIYVGNDVIESYNTAHQNPYWRDWGETAPSAGNKSAYQMSMEAEPRGRLARLHEWLSKHSVVYSMLRATVLPRLSWEKDRIKFQDTPDNRMAWIDPSAPSVRTIFTPRLRLSALDSRLPGIGEGLRITKHAFAALKTAANAQGAQLLVILIPTKEGAYCPYLKASGTRLPEALATLCEAEQQLKEDLARSLEQTGVAYVDVTGALEEGIRSHLQVYSPDSDAHPQGAGYRLIARAVYAAVRQLEAGK
jgi:lysophospholipase L1-like esterase